MKTRDAHPLGIAWVALVFLTLPGAILAIDYRFENPLLRWLVLWMASGLVTFSIIAVVFWVTRIRPFRLPSHLDQVFGFESEAFYRTLGVAAFRRWLLASPLRRLNQDVHLVGCSPASVVRLRSQVAEAEANHMIALLLTLVATPVFAVANTPGFVPWLLLWNLVGNLYPILLQRQSRIRIERVLNRVATRGASGPL